MRRPVPIFAAALSLLCLTGAGQQAPWRLYRSYNETEKADLDKVSAYLNAVHTLQGRFVQIGPDGATVQGLISIAKPGRIRFAYDAPSPVLIVATGGQVYVKNVRLNTVDNYDLSDTPLGLLLNDTVDLSHNKAVMGVREQAGAIIVQARTSANRNDSNISMVFSAPAIELRQWTVKDNQGGITTVALQSSQIGAALDDALFAVPVKNPPRPRSGSN